MAKLDVAAWEILKGQIPLASGRELESHYRHGMWAHYLSFKDTEDNLQHLQICALSSSESALESLGSIGSHGSFEWKSCKESLKRGWSLFLSQGPSWRADKALLRDKKLSVRGEWKLEDCKAKLNDSSSQTQATAWPVCKYNSRTQSCSH